MKLSFVAVIIAVSFLTGCYEMNQDDKGRTVKVNKLTGELSVIENDKIIKLKSEKEVVAERYESDKLGEAKYWPVIPLTILNNKNVSLITKWSGGNIYYQFRVFKNIRNKDSYRAKFNIQLLDDAEFLIQEIPVPISNMTGNLGLDGKTIETMEFKGQLLMSEETYRKLSNWSVTWIGFD